MIRRFGCFYSFVSDNILAKFGIGKLMEMIFTDLHEQSWKMRSGFWCRPDLEDVYGKEFIFLFHINLDIKKISMTVWWENKWSD